jgi:hypothetical protein
MQVLDRRHFFLIFGGMVLGAAAQMQVPQLGIGPRCYTTSRVGPATQIKSSYRRKIKIATQATSES